MVSQMLCCMISTQSEINQSNMRHRYPFHPSWRRRCFAAWSPQNQESINPTHVILGHFIHHGEADALLNN
jgi:hypothetical protein